MNIDEPNIAHIHQNIMELLVEEEIEKQIKHYPENIKSYLNKVDIATYALNRLPPLYASSEKGKNQQIQIGHQKYHQEITTIVRRALAAVERDPIRQSIPILAESDTKLQEAETALEELQQLLKERHLLDESQSLLSWENLVNVLQKAINKVAWRGNSPTTNSQNQPPMPVFPRSKIQKDSTREDITQQSFYWR
jgi:phosphoenolpyruvate carboxylase